MANGTNDFNVNFSAIMWLHGLISNHPNVSEVERTRDIQFDIKRIRGEKIRLICLNEYTCGLPRVYEVMSIFPGAGIIYVGGNWNGYTEEAKTYCVSSKVGLYNSK